jgi:hypothetical protein
MAPPYDYPEEIAQFIAHIACFQTEKEVDGSLRTKRWFRKSEQPG